MYLPLTVETLPVISLLDPLEDPLKLNTFIVNSLSQDIYHLLYQVTNTKDNCVQDWLSKQSDCCLVLGTF